MNTLNHMDQLLQTARQNNHTPTHFLLNETNYQKWRTDVHTHIGTPAAVKGSAYRGIPVAIDDTVTGVALIVEEEALRMEV